MATQLPITIKSAPLAPDFRGRPDDLRKAIIDGLSLETQEELALFNVGSAEPTSNMGPWFQDGKILKVWDDLSGSYVLITIPWKDDINPKPFRGDLAVAQTSVFSGAGTNSQVLAFVDTFDPDNVFDGSTLWVPDNGYYQLNLKLGGSVTAGSPTEVLTVLSLQRNGFNIPRELVFMEHTDPSVGQVISLSTLIELQAGDSIAGAVTITTDAACTYTVTANETSFSGFKVRNKVIT